jgi:hypothetical protein
LNHRGQQARTISLTNPKKGAERKDKHPSLFFSYIQADEKFWFQEDFKLQTHLELGIQIPGKSGNRQPLILPQAHHDFLHHQSISLAPPPLAKSQEDSKAEVYQSAHSDLLFFLSLL